MVQQVQLRVDNTDKTNAADRVKVERSEGIKHGVPNAWWTRVLQNMLPKGQLWCHHCSLILLVNRWYPWKHSVRIANFSHFSETLSPHISTLKVSTYELTFCWTLSARTPRGYNYWASSRNVSAFLCLRHMTYWGRVSRRAEEWREKGSCRSVIISSPNCQFSVAINVERL